MKKRYPVLKAFPRAMDALRGLMVACALAASPALMACSPWQPLTYTWQVVGNMLEIQLNSHTGWQCCYIGRIELRCNSEAFTGTHTHSTNQICKGGGNQNLSTWTTAAFPFQPVFIDLSAYCPGEELKWRARESGPDGFGPYTPTFTFTVPGSSTDPLVVNATADPTSVCPGDCATLTALASGGCGTISYSWSQGGAGATATVCPQTTTTYTVTATATSLCGAFETATAEVTVNVDIAPVAGVASIFPDQVCLGESVTLTLDGMAGDIQWQSADGPGGPWVDIPGATSATYDFSSVAGATWFHAMVTNPFCPPVFSNAVSVAIEPVPPVGFTAPMSCAAFPNVFTDQSAQPGSIVSWTWDFGDGNGSNVQSPVHQYATAGTYDATLTVLYDNGCEGSVTQAVQVMPMPVADFSSVLACANTETALNDLSAVAAPSGIVAWDWDLGNNGTVDYGTQNVSHSFGTGGTYPVSLTVTTESGCTDNIVLPVPVTTAPSAAFVATTVCNGFSTKFTDQSLGAVVQWSWDLGDGTTVPLQHVDHLYANAGTYNVTLTATNDLGCPDAVTQEVTVWPSPVADLVTTDPIGCSPVCVEFTSLSTSVGSDIVYTHWLFGDGSTSQQTTFERCFNNDHPTNDITYDMRLVVMNDLGCLDTLSIADYIQVYHNPTSAFLVNPFETNMYFPDFVVYNQSVGADSYLWDFGDGNTSTDVELLHTYADTGTYTIQLTTYTDFGCTDVSEFTVIVRPIVNLYVPNAFTPDGDGVNDLFFFTGYGIMRSDLEFTVHNRWGEQIFRTTDFLPWDGTYNGVACPDGVYIYGIRYRDTAGGWHFKQGHVTLLR